MKTVFVANDLYTKIWLIRHDLLFEVGFNFNLCIIVILVIIIDSVEIVDIDEFIGLILIELTIETIVETGVAFIWRMTDFSEIKTVF